MLFFKKLGTPKKKIPSRSTFLTALARSHPNLVFPKKTKLGIFIFLFLAFCTIKIN